ncbi:hypothetical protein KSP39_PZI019443 [Platanthera zijinensis]|uniref:Uncharacterized protein n=1 Tax=Platanthera zijinensis TaxID=2320716 RepID=A0AAP0B1Q8_9ASPA
MSEKKPGEISVKKGKAVASTASLFTLAQPGVNILVKQEAMWLTVGMSGFTAELGLGRSSYRARGSSGRAQGLASRARTRRSGAARQPSPHSPKQSCSPAEPALAEAELLASGHPAPELREEILGLVRTALGMRAESATPAVPVVAAPALGDDAPLRRPGKEPVERGEREFQGRVLFPGSAAEYHFGETAGREFPSRPAEGGAPSAIPEGFCEPEMSYYSGRGDPVHHIQWFEDMVSIRQMSDGFKCRLFAITLREKAREWFHQLPTGSVYCFEDLRRGFMLRFTTSRKRKKEAESLFRVKQREMPGRTMMVAFTLGLQSGFFAMELKRSPPVSFEAILERAAREADMEAAHPEFARRLAKWAVEEDRPRGGGRAQEERRAELRQREQPPQQPQPRWGRPEQTHRLGWRPEWQDQAPRRGYQGGDNRQGGRGQFNPQGGRHGQRPPLPDQEEAMAIAMRGRRRGQLRRRREVRVDLPYCDFHQEEGHLTSTCLEFLEMRGNREQQPRNHQEVRIEEIRPRVEEDRCEDRVDFGTRGRIGAIHGGAGIEASRKSSLHTMYRRSVGSTSQSPPPDEKIAFSREDMPGHEDPFCDALVIQTAIEDFTVSRILVDNGSSVNVIFKRAFDSMKVEARRVLASDGPLFGFSGERKEVEGVGLHVTLGGGAVPSYSAIFGRPLISAFRCVPSSFHQCLKFNVEGVQIRIRGDPKEARECYVSAVNSISWQEGAEEMGRRLEEGEQEAGGGEMKVEGYRTQAGVAEEAREPVEPMIVEEAGEEILALGGEGTEEWGEQSRLEAAEEVVEMEVLTIGGRMEKVRVSGGLTPKAQGRMLECIQKNVDVFAWNASEMPGIDSNVACHRLNLDTEARPIQQKKRSIADKLAEPIREEVAKLLEAGFVSEIQYPGWVSNVVMVKKGDGRLKNAGATYQKMMDMVFREQRGRNLEVYVDDLMIKSLDVDSHLRDLEETFATLRKYKMRLNPLKCTFGASRGKFLGHLLTPAGVEPNPDKAHSIRVVTDHPLRSIFEGVEHSGRLAKWSVELSEFDISFVPRLSIKAQAMADFLADYVVEVAEEQLTRPVPWKVVVDGASGRHSLGVGVILESPQGIRIEQTVVVHFPITNNQAEYEAVIAGLRLARELGVHDVEVLTDSMVVASQINGEFEVREPTLQLYLAKAKRIIGAFQTFSIRHVSREENEQADQLAKHGPRVGGTITDLFRPSIEEGELMEVEQHPSWMDPFVTFLSTGEYPEGMDRRGLKHKEAYYLLREGELYRKTLSGMLARCVAEREAIVTDNGPQFASAEFISFCEHLGIDLRFASVHHPRRNGQVEATNKIIVNLLKKKVENLRGSWVEQLPSVLWALRTTPNTATGETPFKLSHGCEAVLPIEFEVRTPRVAEAEAAREGWRSENEEELRLSLDMIEELRDLSTVRQEEVKRRMAKYFSKHVRVK